MPRKGYTADTKVNVNHQRWRGGRLAASVLGWEAGGIGGVEAGVGVLGITDLARHQKENGRQRARRHPGVVERSACCWQKSRTRHRPEERGNEPRGLLPEEAMVKRKPAWFSVLPRGTRSTDFTLDELRNFKEVHALLTERLPGPPAISYLVQSFRFLQIFAIASVVEGKAPPLQRASSQLEQLFGRDPAFEDGIFVWSWLLFDFPFGPQGQTALDLFEQFFQDEDAREQFRPFIAAVRPSRLGLHQDIGRTKKIARLRELFTGRTVAALPSVEEHSKGEIFLARLIHLDGHAFLFGNPHGFPAEYRKKLEEMILGKLFYFPGASTNEQYERFMKLAGPYWMSCVTPSDAIPILPPDHYLTYLAP